MEVAFNESMASAPAWRALGLAETGNGTDLGGTGRSYYDIYGLYFVAAGVIVLCSLAASAYWAIKRRASMLSVLPIYILYISLGDFVSDCTFVAYMPREPPVVDALRKASFVFILGASVINVAAVAGYTWWTLSRGGPKYMPFRRWLERHKGITAITMFLSLTSARMVSLLTSGLFEMTAFSAPLPISAIETLELIGLITVILEDVPQLIVTVVISTESNTWDSVAFTALAFSVASVALSVSCRVVMLHHITDEERQRDDSFNPEYLKAHKAYRKGSLRTIRHLYSGAGMEEEVEAVEVQSRMPETLAAALKAISPAPPGRGYGFSNRKLREQNIRVNPNPLAQLQPHDVYAAVSVPVVAPVLVNDKGRRRPSLFRKSMSDSGSEYSGGASAAAAAMGVAYDAVAAASSAQDGYSPTKLILAAAKARQLAPLPVGVGNTAGSGETEDRGGGSPGTGQEQVAQGAGQQASDVLAPFPVSVAVEAGDTGGTMDADIGAAMMATSPGGYPLSPGYPMSPGVYPLSQSPRSGAVLSMASSLEHGQDGDGNNPFHRPGSTGPFSQPQSPPNAPAGLAGSVDSGDEGGKHADLARSRRSRVRLAAQSGTLGLPPRALPPPPKPSSLS